jgi:hypothetical protein
MWYLEFLRLAWGAVHNACFKPALPEPCRTCMSAHFQLLLASACHGFIVKGEVRGVS